MQERLINFKIYKFSMKDPIKIYNILFWLSLLSILVWVILKIVGVI